MKLIQVRLFGAFRKYQPEITLEIALNATVQDLKETLLNLFDDKKLIMESAIADEKQILLPQELIGSRTWLAVLPPVCGG